MPSTVKEFDLLVVGGGINGVGIAADAAGRGIRTALCEMGDLASGTSSGSSKLIHGGLRYLEYYEFKLVKESLHEREVLLRNAPHLVHPMRFRLPHTPTLRPAWMIRAGMFLYDHLSKRARLSKSTFVRFGDNNPLQPQFKNGFEYSDLQTDDARLVLTAALQAKQKGAEIFVRHRCIAAKRQNGQWQVTLRNELDHSEHIINARVLINATGPWVTHLFDEALALDPPKQVRLVKGSHIIVPRVHPQQQAYLLQNTDRRVVFVVPYLEKFSMIGTTDVDFDDDPAKANIADQEIDYLIDVSNRHFKHQIGRNDIVATWSAIRPLMDAEVENPQAVTRDYSFELSDEHDQPPLLTIYGGKLTTFRALAEKALKKLHRYFPDAGPSWTARAVLPGGDFADFDEQRQQLHKSFPWLPETVLNRYLASYGTRTYQMLNGCHSLQDLGTFFGDTLYQKEIDFQIEQEWAMTGEDVLRRRTPCYLFLSDQQKKSVHDYVKQKTGF